MKENLICEAASLLDEFERTWNSMPIPLIIAGDTRVGTPLCRMFLGKNFTKAIHILYSGPDNLGEFWPELGYALGAYYAGPMMGFELLNYAKPHARPILGCNDPEVYPRICGRIALSVFDPDTAKELVKREILRAPQFKCFVRYLDFCERRAREAVEFRNTSYATWRKGATIVAKGL